MQIVHVYVGKTLYYKDNMWVNFEDPVHLKWNVIPHEIQLYFGRT